MSHTDRSGWRDARFDALAGEWERAAGLAGVGGEDGLLGIEYDGGIPRMIVLYRPATLMASPAPATTRALCCFQARARLPTLVCSYWPDADRPAFAPCRLDGAPLVDAGVIWTERQWVGLLYSARRRTLPDGLDLAAGASRQSAVDDQCRWLSCRHRRWGLNAPMVDVDRILYDPASGEPLAILDGKCAVREDGARPAHVLTRHLEAAGLRDGPPHPSYQATRRLADRARIAAFVVLYSHQHDWVRAWPTNVHAENACGSGEGMSTAAWTTRLAGLSGKPVHDEPQPVPTLTPWHAPDGTRCPPDPAQPSHCAACGLRFEGVHPFDCRPDDEQPGRAQGGMSALREWDARRAQR